ncbi:hypothetical protein HY750_00930, partial [Candidatus Kuenenbacteria bacterium]|nr:hypothetical protein [Candidatus Kuenenbacteria bacterium]
MVKEIGISKPTIIQWLNQKEYKEKRGWKK